MGRNPNIRMSSFFITLPQMKYETKLLIWYRGLSYSSRKIRNFHLDEFQPCTFFGKINITVPMKKGGIWYWWLTAGEKSWKNASITYFNDRIDNSILYAEGNSCELFAMPVIEITFDNDYIHLLHDLPKQYIFGYLISKLISSETTIQKMI